MHIDGVPNRTSRPTYLLRESYREGKKVRKRTIANLSALSDEQIDGIRAVPVRTNCAPGGGVVADHAVAFSRRSAGGECSHAKAWL